MALIQDLTYAMGHVDKGILHNVDQLKKEPDM